MQQVSEQPKLVWLFNDGTGKNDRYFNALFRVGDQLEQVRIRCPFKGYGRNYTGMFGVDRYIEREEMMQIEEMMLRRGIIEERKGGRLYW